jgi:hypothetical protein
MTVFMREFSWKRQLLLIFLVCFLLGVLLVCFGMDSFAEQGGKYLSSMERELPRSAELLIYVAVRRLLVFFALLCFGTGSGGKRVHGLFILWSGFSYGCFCMLCLGSFGARGLLLGLLSVFPQCLLYIPVYLGLVEFSRRHGIRWWKKVLWLLVLILLLEVGILLESYVAPIILQKIVKIM